jgi:hypothetical protein
MMIKVGDLLKNEKSEEVFRVKSVNPSLIILATKDEYHSLFVNPNTIESEFQPFEEDEAKNKPK